MRPLSLLLRGTAVALVAAALWYLTAASATRGSAMAALPGAAPYAESLRTRLRRAVINQGRAYEPRTHHRNADGLPTYTNRLILEKSPYLLQHAHNPVDWYPWGDEAFERARRENKPVLLSIGYSTCHWCHVMEEESFDNEEIAAFLNQHYVAIKVDRERRPDVDGVYVTAVQMLAGQAGWPLTVWLTPDRQPFYGGTYFPPRDGDRGVRTGFLTVLDRLQDIYRKQPQRAAEAGADLARQIQQAAAGAPSAAVPTTVGLLSAYQHFAGRFDAANGGFGAAPKFPRSVELEFLLRYHRRTGDAQALEMVRRTLRAMADGGIYDHIGGGFHRYATDAAWRIPHFEKMLYDNALLAVAYLDAYQVTHDPELARVVRETLAYVEREMTAPEGGFYTASDADSEGAEGTFFVWTPAEIGAVLESPQRELALAYYGVSDTGNFHGRNALHVARSLDAIAEEMGIDSQQARRDLDAARARLYAARGQRPRPHTDRKIIPASNGLMITAFSRAAQVLDQPDYIAPAARAANFIFAKLREPIPSRQPAPDTREPSILLHRSYFDDEASGTGFLDDYAFLIAGLLDLFEASHDPLWLRRALALQDSLDTHFWDDQHGGYFFTADEHEVVLAREKPAYDGAEPAGNSVALLNLLRLYELTGEARYRERAEAALRTFERLLTFSPASVPRMLAALDFYTDTPKEIVIVTPDSAASAAPFLAKLRSTYLPNRVVAVVSDGAAAAELATLVPLTSAKIAKDGQPTAYVCERRVCDLPTTDPEIFATQIARVHPIAGSENAALLKHAQGRMGNSRQ